MSNGSAKWPVSMTLRKRRHSRGPDLTLDERHGLTYAPWGLNLAKHNWSVKQIKICLPQLPTRVRDRPEEYGSPTILDYDISKNGRERGFRQADLGRLVLRSLAIQNEYTAYLQLYLKTSCDRKGVLSTRTCVNKSG